MKKIKQFTLVELLVVIAIILILLSLIQPALRRAIDQAKQAVCLNNLRNLGTVLMLYSDDNNGEFPRGNRTSPSSPGIDGTYFVSKDSPMGIAIPYMEGYFDNPETMYCPLWEHPYLNLDTLDSDGEDVWVKRSNAFGGFHRDKTTLPTMFVGISYAYRTTLGPKYDQHVNPKFDDPTTTVITDHFARREVLYGLAYGHPDSYGALYLDNSAKNVQDSGHIYMFTKQPHFDKPKGAPPHACNKYTNGAWALMEDIYENFFEAD